MGWLPCLPACLQSERAQFGRLKKVMKYLFSGSSQLQAACQRLLRAQSSHLSSDQLLEDICQEVRRHWQQGGPREQHLISHMALGKAGAKHLA